MESPRRPQARGKEDRLSFPQVLPNYTHHPKFPWTVDSRVAKTLMARKHFNALRKANPQISLEDTTTRFFAYESQEEIPLLGKT